MTGENGRQVSIQRHGKVPLCEEESRRSVPRFRRVDVDKDDQITYYLEKVENLVCPVKGVLNDPFPLVFGETKRELVERTQYFGRGSKIANGVQRILPLVMRKATLSSCGISPALD